LVLNTKVLKIKIDYLPVVTMKNPFVSFIIVDYDKKKFLKTCIDSIYKQNYPKYRFEIIVVENSSSSEPVEFVKTKYPKARILVNKENNFASANNLGARNSRGEYLAFLNNDTRLDKNWLIELIKVTEKDEKIGIAGGKVLFMNGRIQSVGHEEYPNFYWGDIGINEVDRGQYDKISERVSLCGVAILVRKKCFEDIGHYDEEFNVYLEDVELAIRAGQKNWKIMYIPKSIIYHEYMGTNSKDREKRLIEKNRLVLLAKHFPEKLPIAISSSQYFYIEKKYDHLFETLPMVIGLLNKKHPRKAAGIIEELFANLRKAILLENKALSIDSEFKNEIAELNKRVDSLKDQLIFEKETALNLNRENRKLSDENHEFLAQNKRLSNDNYLLLNEKQRLSAENHDMLNKMQRLSEENQDLSAEKQALQDENQNLFNEIKTLKDILNRKIFELEDLRKSKPYRFLVKPINIVYSSFFPKKNQRKLLKSR
jgi:GT2 family glycosyltransferase